MDLVPGAPGSSGDGTGSTPSGGIGLGGGILPSLPGLPGLPTPAPNVTSVDNLMLVSDTGSSSTDLVTNFPDISFDVSAIDTAHKLTVQVGDAAPVDILGEVAADGPFTLSGLRLEQIYGASLPDGDLTIRLKPSQLIFGEEVDGSTQVLSFTLDRTGPTAIFGLAEQSDTSPLGDGITEINPVTLEGTTESGAAVTLGDTTVFADGSGHFEFSDIELALGSNEFELTIVDLSGNSSSITQTVVREALDNAAPTVTVDLVTDSGVAGDRVTNTAALQGQVGDDSNITSLMARVNGGSLSEFVDGIDGAGNFTLSREQLAQLNGGSLGDGELTVEIQARDERGNLSEFVSYTFTLDTTSPAAIFGLASRFDTPPVGDGSTEINPVILEGTTEAGTQVTLGNITVTADGNGRFEFNDIELALGANEFEITVVDEAGNQGTVRQMVVREAVDGDAPTIAAGLVFDSGVAGDLITNDPTLQGQVVDDSTVTSVMVRVNGGPLTEVLDTVDVDGNFTLSRERLTQINGGTLPDGELTVEFTAVDERGNLSEFVASFTLDTSAPTGIFGLASRFDTPPVGDGSTEINPVTLEGATEAGAQVTLGNVTVTADSEGLFEFDNIELALGANNFELTIVDVAGNTGTIRQTVVREAVDGDVPTVAVGLITDSGVGNDLITNDPTLQGQVVDDSIVTGLMARVNGGPLVDVLDTVDGDGNFTLSREQLAQINGGTLPDGELTIEFKAGDERGNLSEFIAYTFTLDTQAPNAIFGLADGFDSPPVGDGETTLNPVTLTGQTEAGATVVLLSSGAEVTADGTGAFQFNGIELALGANSFEIEVSDAVGNSSSVQQTVVRLEPTPVDTTKPVVVAGLVNDTGSSNNDLLTSDAAISGTVSDESDIDRFVVSLNDSTTLVEVADRLDGSGKFEFSAVELENLLGPLTDGANRINFQAVDSFGNMSLPTSVEFVLDRAAPDVSVGLDALSDPDGDGTTDQASVSLAGQTEAGLQVQWLDQGRAATAEANGQFIFEGAALELGNNPITLRVVDDAGNQTDLSEVFVRVEPADRDAPVISTALANDTGRSDTDRLTADSSLVGQVVDTSAITSITLQINGVSPAVEILDHLDGDGNFALSPEQLNGIYGDELPDGPYELVLQATDALDNISQPLLFNFVLDTTPPNLAGAFTDVINGQTTSNLGSLAGQTEPGATVTLAETGGSTTADDSGNFIFDDVPLALGTNVFTLTSTDVAGNQEQILRAVTRVVPTEPVENRAPQIISGPQEEVLLGQPYRSQIEAIDADGDALTYELLSGPEGLALDGGTGELVWDADAITLGNYAVQVRVSDDKGGATEESYTLRALDLPPNRPPIFTSTPVVDGVIGQPYVYDADAIDPDNDDFTYSVAQGPDGLTVDPDTGLVEWTPSQPAILGNTIFGRISNPGEQDSFKFSGTAGQRIYLDPFFFNGNASDWSLTLTDSDGVELSDTDLDFRSFPNSRENESSFQEKEKRFIALPKNGDYTVNIDGKNNVVGNYGVKIVDVDLVPELSFNTITKGVLASGSQDSLYRFRGEAGQKILIQNNSSNFAMDWVLYDPTSDEIDSDSQGQDREIELSRDGDYILALRGDRDFGSRIEYEFQITLVDEVDVITPTFVTEELVIGSEVSGQISDQDEKYIYIFNGEEKQTLFFDSLVDTNVPLTVSILNERDEKLWEQDQEIDRDGAPFTLPAKGEYRLVIEPPNNSTENYNFRLIDVDASPIFPFDTGLTPDFKDNARGTEIYQFQAEADTRVYFDAAGDFFNRYWLYGPDNSLLSTPSGQPFNSDVEYELLDGGTYTLALQGNGRTGGNESLIARLADDVSNPLPLGDVVNGTISGAGDRHIYEFTGTAGQLLFLDGIAGDGNALATLTGPNDQPIFSDSIDRWNREFLTLPQDGSYHLEVDGNQGWTGDYSFKLSDRNDVPLISPDIPVAGTVENYGINLYRIDGLAGQVLDLNWIERDRATWRLYDPGNQEITPSGGTNSDINVGLPVDGIYTLAVDIFSSSSTNYRFEAQQYISSDNIISTGLGQVLAGTLAGGDSQRHTFTGYAGQQIYIDSLLYSNSSFTEIDIYSPSGKDLFGYQASRNDRAPFTLPENGEYTVEISASREDEYSIQLLDLSEDSLEGLPIAEEITIGEVISGTLQGREAKVYSFDGYVGQALVPNAISGAYGTATLYGPNGERVSSFDGSRDRFFSINTGGPESQVTTLTQDGKYHLVLDSTSSTLAERPYKFQLLDFNAGRDITLQSPIEGSLLSAQNSDVYKISGKAGQRLYFDLLEGSDRLEWELYGPDYKAIDGTRRDFSRDIEDVVLPYDGEYTLYLKGGTTDIPVDYQFQVFADNAVESQPNIIVPGYGDTVAGGGEFQSKIPVTLEVEDVNGATAVQEYTIQLNPNESNIAPRIISEPTDTVSLNQERYEYRLEVFDPNGDDLQYQLINAPNGAFIDQETGTVTWFPQLLSVGETYDFSIQVTDPQGGIDVQAFTVTAEQSRGSIKGLVFDDLNANGVRDTNAIQGDDVKILFSVDTSGSTGGFVIPRYVSWGDPNTTLDNFDDGQLTIQDLEWASVVALTEHLLETGQGEGVDVGYLAFGFDTGDYFRDADRFQPGLQNFVDATIDRNDNGVPDYREAFSAYTQGVSALSTGQAEAAKGIAESLPEGETLNVVILSDGYVTTDEEAFAELRALPNVNVSAFGIGRDSDIDTLRRVDPDAVRIEDIYQVAEIFGNLTFGSTGEPAVEDVTVYLDLNNDGQLSLDDPYQVTKLDKALLPNGSSNPFTFEFNGLEPGEYTLRQIVPSGREQTAPVDAFVDTITVAGGETYTHFFGLHEIGEPPNEAPEFVTTPPSEAIAAREPFQYSAIALDPDADGVTYDLPLAPEGAAVDPDSGTVIWTPSAEQAGKTFDVLLRARDERGAQSVQAFKLTVDTPNQAPVFTTDFTDLPSPQVGKPFELDVQAIDPDGDDVFYRVVNGPAEAEFDNGTGRLTWEAASESLGEQLITIAATDGTDETQETIALNVIPAQPNRNPIISDEPDPRFRAQVGTPYTYTVPATDPDGDRLTYTLISGPEGITVDSDNGRLVWVPTPEQFGEQTITVEVTEGQGGSDTDTWTVEVLNSVANSTPVITSTPDRVTNLDQGYQYQLEATDPDGDSVLWLLDEAPDGAVLDPLTGALSWQPTADQLGSSDFVVRALDSQGAFSGQAFSVQVNSSNTPPAITSVPPTEIGVTQTYRYGVEATDPEGDVVRYGLGTAPDGVVIDELTGELTWATPVQGSYDIEVIARDTQDGVNHQQYTLQVGEAAVNQGPTITSSPSLSAGVGNEYIYQVTATDPENDALTYRLAQNVPGAALDSVTGALSWTPSSSGTQQFDVLVTDPSGSASGQQFTVTAVDDQPPEVVGFNPPATAVPNALYQYDVVATDPNGTALTYQLDEGSIAAGVTIDNQGRVRWTPTEEQGGDRQITITVADESGSTRVLDFTVTVTADTTEPTVRLLPLTPVAVVDDNTFQVNQGDTVRFQVAATDDVGVAGVQLFADGQPLALDGNGTVELTADQTQDLQGWAIDGAGNIGTTDVTLNAIDTSDVTPPEVFLDPRAFKDPITTFTDIFGYAYDPDGTLDYYSLSVAPANVDDAEFVEILRVEDTDVDSTSELGQFDPTTLQNDSYRLRLTAVDQGGNINSTETRVDVRGELKLGNFQLSFTDLEIPVAGIPITVTRTYDTLTVNEKDDFGFGWRLEFRDTNLRTSLRDPSPEEELLGRYPGFNDGDRVYVTMPGGRRVGFTFEAKLDPRFAAAGIPLPQALQFRTPTFIPDDGVEAELTVPSQSLTYNAAAGAYAIVGSAIPFNPANQTLSGAYTLTTKEGIRYDIDAITGDLSSATDLNGNTLTFSDKGIVSDTGVAVTFERDPMGRIERVIDPEGNVIKYGYDANGDLTSVRDGKNSEGEYIETTFVYDVEDRPHYLNEIKDPLGRSGVKTEYDEQGRLRRTVDVNGEAVVINYDPGQSTQTVKDIYGEETIYVYDDRGNVLTELDPIGRKIERTYNADDNVERETIITIEDGVELRRTTKYTYDDEGNQLTITNDLDQTSRSVYGEYGRLLSESDALGNTTKYQYDDRGNLTQTEDAEGNITKFEYDRRGNLTTLIDANDQPTKFVYNSRGDVESTEDADGNITTYKYDDNGLREEEIQTVTTPEGVREVKTQMFYDDAERLEYTIDAEGNRTDYKYDDNGNQIEVIDGRRNSTFSVYDEKNQLVETIYPDATPGDLSDNPRTVTVYDKGDRRRASIDELGRVTHFVYDAVGRMVETIYSTDEDTLAQFIGVLQTRDGQSVAGNSLATVDWTDVVFPDDDQIPEGYLASNPRTRTEYLKTGEVKAEIDELGNRTEFRYDSLGRVIETIYADNTPNDLSDNPRATSTYDAAGRQVFSTDTRNNTTTQVYDNLGRVVETRFADETVTKTEYDKLGRRTAAIDALGRRTEFEYDDLGRLTDVVQFLDGRQIRTEYGYDELGRQLFQEDANDNRTSFTYDLLGRRTSVTLPGDQVSTSTYDPNGNLRTYTDFNGEVMSYTYDEQNRLTFLDLEDDPDVTYTYTLNGLQNTIADGRGVTEFTYDSRNRLVGQKDPFGPYTGDNFSLEYQYDIAGNRTQVTTPGGVTSYTFDERNRIETVTDSAQGNTTYTYDGESNLTQTTLPNGIIETRTYDELNRLTRIEQKDGDTVISSYTYDLNEVGNRTSVTEADGRQVNYQYDDLDRLTQETITDPGNSNDGRTYTYQYDDVGNRTVGIDSVEGTTTYTYDDNDRLLQETTNGISTTYTYDANGNTRTQTVDGQAPTTYTWDDRNRLVTVNTSDGDTVSYEYDDNNIRVSSTVGNLKTTYVVDSNRPYHQVLEEYEDGNIKARYVHGLDLISVEQDGDTSIYLVDGLGSTRTLTDASTGDVVAAYDYDAYGELIDSSSTVDNNYLFAGEQFDDNLDQYYLRQRFYNPGSGRFTRRDTYEGRIGEPITLNKYLYAHANPVFLVDYSGEAGNEPFQTERGKLVHDLIGFDFKIRDPLNREFDASFARHTIRKILLRLGRFTVGVNSNALRPDLVDFANSQLYEIKPKNSQEDAAGQLKTYLDLINLQLEPGDTLWTRGSVVNYVPPPVMVTPPATIIFIDPPNSQGVIEYRTEDRTKELLATAVGTFALKLILQQYVSLLAIPNMRLVS